MIALGGILAAILPFLPAIISLVSGIFMAWHGTPAVVANHPAATAVTAGTVGALLNVLPSPFKPR